jgi:hypothetical protein
LSLPWFSGKLPPSYFTGAVKPVFQVVAALTGISAKSVQRNTGQYFIEDSLISYLLWAFGRYPYIPVFAGVRRGAGDAIGSHSRIPGLDQIRSRVLSRRWPVATYAAPASALVMRYCSGN